MKKYLAVIAGICLLTITFAGCGGSNVVQDTTLVFRDDLVVSIPVSGSLEMPHKVSLSFGTTGTVKDIEVCEGDHVERGQELARLDVPKIEASVKMRQVEYQMAQYQLMQTIYPINYICTYDTDLPGTWIALNEAQKNLLQAQKLLQRGELEQARSYMDQVKENLDKAENKSAARIWALPFSVRLAELNVDKAEAALDMAKADLAQATITAPFVGTVAGIEITEGEQLSAATYTSPAICLIDTGEVKMTGLIDETDISQVRVGQEAVVTMDALPGRELDGEVTFVSPAGTTQAGVVSYKSTIALTETDADIRDSMSATADVIIDRRDDVLLLSNRAIQGSWENPYVEVVTSEVKTEERTITLGLSDGMHTEILSGLEEGETVVVPPASQFAISFFG
ncbi:MAG: efflux RND transporter periplasmic adaptor subunit [Chloroflexota bacterium]|nr:efflux RND transporter periplasmic adaptor subunit [Chloroflexota bacterium]